MKICLIGGSPRPAGNTSVLAGHFVKRVIERGEEVDEISLLDKKVLPCMGCAACQKVPGKFGCVLEDDMQNIAMRVASSDCFLLVSPIYAWYCTSDVKAVLDRLVYGMNKFYGIPEKSSLWAGKSCGIIATCGYSVDKGCDLFEEGVKRTAKHSNLVYKGMLAMRHKGDTSVFSSPEAIKLASDFADSLIDG